MQQILSVISHCVPGFQGPFVVQTWLLTACAFLCLGPGDAIRCRLCNALGLSKFCVPVIRTCEVNNGVCVVVKYFAGHYLMNTVKTCGSADIKICGSKGEISQNGHQYEINCCSDRDFCSTTMYH